MKTNLTNEMLEALNPVVENDPTPGLTPGEPCMYGDKEVTFQSANDDETTAKITVDGEEVEVQLSELSPITEAKSDDDDDDDKKKKKSDDDDDDDDDDKNKKKKKSDDDDDDDDDDVNECKAGDEVTYEDEKWTVKSMNEDDTVTIEKDGDSKTVSKDDIK